MCRRATLHIIYIHTLYVCNPDALGRRATSTRWKGSAAKQTRGPNPLRWLIFHIYNIYMVELYSSIYLSWYVSVHCFEHTLTHIFIYLLIHTGGDPRQAGRCGTGGRLEWVQVLQTYITGIYICYIQAIYDWRVKIVCSNTWILVYSIQYMYTYILEYVYVYLSCRSNYCGAQVYQGWIQRVPT